MAPTAPVDWLFWNDAPQAIDNPRGIDVAPNGDLLVLSRNQRKIYVLYEDASGDSVQVEIGTAANLNHALRYRDGYLYFSSDTTVYRYVKFGL